MKKDIKSTDKISEGTLHEILLDIKYRLDHLEDIEADNRALIVKMIKQGNSIVKFLARIDIEPIEPIESIETKINLPQINQKDSNKMRSLRELINEFMEKKEDLKEFEEELKKHKHMLTPGQLGEA